MSLSPGILSAFLDRPTALYGLSKSGAQTHDGDRVRFLLSFTLYVAKW